MLKTISVPLWAVLSISDALVGGVYLLGQSRLGVPQSVVVQSPASVAPHASPPASIAASQQTVYINKYYNYALHIPTGWRLAVTYMQKWNATIPLTNYSLNTAEYVVLTKSSEAEESKATALLPGGSDDAFAAESLFITPYSLTLDRERDLLSQTITSNQLTTEMLQQSGVDAFVSTKTSPIGNTITSLYFKCTSSQIVRSAAGSNPLVSIGIRKETNTVPKELLLSLANSFQCE